MFSRPTTVVLSAILPGLLLVPPALCAPIDDWNAIILAGSNHKFEGKYNLASQSFTKAVSFAEKQKLPDKCLPISLCRLAEVELITNDVKEADSHFERITNLIKTQKNTNKLDPQVNFWGAGLADAYESNHRAETRELCLKHACYLKTLVYGANHRECTDCLSKLADYYIDNGQTDKALKILSFREALMIKIFGKSADRFGDMLNDLALKCEKEHKNEQAKQLELAVINIAPTNIGSINAGLPAFYSFLGMNTLAEGKSAESKEYFQKAMRACRKIKGSLRKQWACKYLALLPASICPEKSEQKKLRLAQREYEQLLAINKAIPTTPDLQYDVYSKLAEVLFTQDVLQGTATQMPHVIECFKACIAIAQLPTSSYKNALPDLYTRLGCCQFYLHNFSDANKSFIKALELETDKKGYHTASVLFWWGDVLEHIKKSRLAAEKFNIAFEQASALPPAKRGTLLADLLQKAAIAAQEHGDQRKAQQLFKQSSVEIQLQKQLNTKLGPDFYHRMCSTGSKIQ